ncbi:hypothetical protein [Oleidesulfovibrio sp.]|uniref:hypothetical protein n=1 Tax=Oleidesulfovibrio sp. TaxID=2909707 RepID=UPI003A8627BF
MRILHLLSQRPEMTGSGVYTLAMMRCSLSAGHDNAIVAGVPAEFVVPRELAVQGQVIQNQAPSGSKDAEQVSGLLPTEDSGADADGVVVSEDAGGNVLPVAVIAEQCLPVQ